MPAADSTTSASSAAIRQRLRQSATYFGTLDRLSHEQFVDLVRSNGGRYVPYRHGIRTGVLVIGAGDLPMTPSGEPMRFEAVLTCGEAQFIAAVDAKEVADSDDHHFTLESLAELLHVPPRRVRAWLKAGLIRPRRSVRNSPRFDLRQASIARTLVNQMAGGVTVQRLRQGLQAVRQWLPDVSEPLQQLSVLERHGDMLIRLESGELAQLDGQLQLDFESSVQIVDIGSEPSSYRLHPAAPASTPPQWHELAIEQEQAGLLDDAEKSYRQALLVGGPEEQIIFDLAYLLARKGDDLRAIERYRQVVELNPRRADAWNNLGVLLAGTDQLDEAIRCFRRSIELDGTDPDARYNLADTLDQAQLSDEADRHYQAYLRAAPEHSPWTNWARRRLAASER